MAVATKVKSPCTLFCVSIHDLAVINRVSVLHLPDLGWFLCRCWPVTRWLTTRGLTACAGTQVTPVWRAGPSGPKTLCNACGVRYMKNAKKR